MGVFVIGVLGSTSSTFRRAAAGLLFSNRTCTPGSGRSVFSRTIASSSISKQTATMIKKRVDNVIKSANDDRQYRCLELSNGLRALLVSDPEADKSAAAMDVAAGHLMDPRELPGIAHFCEHMLFLGTKKYESENEYFKYIQSHGGSSNAYTASDHTNYHFDITPASLGEGVDRFAQFFLGPLFTESATDREVKAVDSENSNNLKNDQWRIMQLERSLSDAEHDYSKFGTGNKQTLMDIPQSKQVDTRQALLAFHKQWYSSNLMGLCIVGKESLDELEKNMLLPYFAHVPNYEDKSRAMSLATSMANKLHYYPMEHILNSQYLMDQYKPELIQTILDCLVPEKMNFVVVSQHFAGQKHNLREQWYDTEYAIQDIDKGLLSKCAAQLTNQQSAHFRMPKPNEFIPSNFEMLSAEPQAHDKSAKFGIPQLIRNERALRVWYKQDDEFKLPKSSLYATISTPAIYADPTRTNTAQLLASCLQDSLTEYTYNASLAGLGGGFHCGKYALKLTVGGYNDKLAAFTQSLLQYLMTYKVDVKRFEVLKELYVRELRNFAQEQPYQHAMYHSNCLLTNVVWSKDELLDTALDIKAEDVDAFIPELLSNVHLELYVHGNTNKQQVQDLAESLYSTLTNREGCRHLVPSQLWRDRECKLPKGEWLLHSTENATHTNSALEIIWQTGVSGYADVRLDLLTQIMAEPAFDTLRTKEQLGYIVFSGARRSHGVEGLRVIVQGERDPRHVEARVEAFLIQMRTLIENMSADEFNDHVTSLKAKRLERPKRQSELAGRFHSEIESKTYCFDRHLLDAEQLSSVTQSDLLSYFDEFIAQGAAHRRKFTSRVTSTQLTEEPDHTQLIDDTNANVVDDFHTFKQHMELWPLPHPYFSFDDLNTITNEMQKKAKL